MLPKYPFVLPPKFLCQVHTHHEINMYVDFIYGFP